MYGLPAKCKRDSVMPETAYVCGHSADTGEPEVLKL